MSRSLSNFLLFEDLFDNLSTTNPSLTELASQIFSPYVTVVQEDCATKLGKKVKVSREISGLVKVEFNGTLEADRTIPESYRFSKEDIESMLATSMYTTYVRDLHYCTSVGGICASCYASTFGLPAPEVGTQVRVQNEYILRNDSYSTREDVKSYKIVDNSEVAGENTYDYTLAYLDNHLLQEGVEYTVDSDNYLTLTEFPLEGQYLSINSVLRSNKPFMTYLANRYSGSLVGLKSITTQPTTLPLGVIDRGISEGQIDQLYTHLTQLSLVDQTVLDYYSRITNRLEKALFVITLYSIFNDIQT